MLSWAVGRVCGAFLYGMTHPTVMLIALAVLHIGRHRSRKADSPREGRILTVTALVTLGLILAAIRW